MQLSRMCVTMDQAAVQFVMKLIIFSEIDLLAEIGEFVWPISLRSFLPLSS